MTVFILLVALSKLSRMGPTVRRLAGEVTGSAQVSATADVAVLDARRPERPGDVPPGHRRPPWRGLALLGVSAGFSAALLIYFGAWSALDRVEARQLALAPRAEAAAPVEAWWEEGLLWVCPLH